MWPMTVLPATSESPPRSKAASGVSPDSLECSPARASRTAGWIGIAPTHPIAVDAAVETEPDAPQHRPLSSPHTSQHPLPRDVYEGTIRELALGVVEGLNGTVFAYGATGSGKTHTMVGEWAAWVGAWLG